MSMRQSRREALSVIGSGLAVGVVAACTPAAPSVTPPATAPVGGDRFVHLGGSRANGHVRSSRASGGTLRFGTAADLLTLDGQDFSSGGEGVLGVWDRSARAGRKAHAAATSC